MAQQVDFYVLEQADLAGRLVFIGRLIAKILSHDKRVVVLVEDNEAAARVDELLWHSPPESFIPHEIFDPTKSQPTNTPETVTIAASETAVNGYEVCINLRDHIPSNHGDLERLVEVVCQDPQVLHSTREKYRFYRKLGYPLQSHSINAGAV
jgi:DNA polymerase-3 subunit chi